MMRNSQWAMAGITRQLAIEDQPCVELVCLIHGSKVMLISDISTDNNCIEHSLTDDRMSVARHCNEF